MPECLYRASIGGQSGGFPLKTRGNDGQYDPAEQLPFQTDFGMKLNLHIHGFLLRQFFLTILKALDEAATIDRASPLRILISTIIPNAWPAIVAVSLFHFFYAWNDFFEPLIYLSATPDLQPISAGMQVFNALYAQQPHLIQSTALLGMALAVLLFFMAQKVFLQGASMAGVSK